MKLVCDKDVFIIISVYNMGESCCSMLLILELNQVLDEGDFKNFMLCLVFFNIYVFVLSDIEKQIQILCGQNEGFSDEYVSIGLGFEVFVSFCKQNCMGEFFQDLYMQYVDVMYINQVNL